MDIQEIESLRERVSNLKANANPVNAADYRFPDSEIIQLLASVTDHLHKKSNEKELYDSAVARLTVIESDITHIRNNVDSLCRIVRDGNGQPSFIQRLSKLEAEVERSQEDLEEVKCHATSIIAAKALSRSQILAGLSGMVLTALLSSLALIATLLK